MFWKAKLYTVKVESGSNFANHNEWLGFGDQSLVWLSEKMNPYFASDGEAAKWVYNRS